ncbi:microcin-processing peptidase 1. Unknown type peptidase. MEROPS family U62 [Thalassococcus halodurans]|uniref:PmbA protein n=1 Tax=Thalassococcus halodurans TaxID=373675 RepID=A0A1H5UAZ1_9RHOB|nr:TldD/PmbA family protein [Thalassococcus halodurans]SEF71427.1 microcin-processing peptidase 1. Unknown type peptidase. MEROPS family U62 [Thalassococcus halodurans]
MAHNLSDLTQQLLEAAKKAGADAADALAVDGTSISIDVRNGKLEQAERSDGVEIGLRVLLGQRSATISASDVRPETMAMMAERAVAMAQEAPDDPYIGLADADQIIKDFDVEALELFDASAEPAPADLEQDAIRAEAAALAVDGITQIDGCSAGYGSSNVHLAASNGFSGGYKRSSRSISCIAIAGTGTEMERDYDGDSRIFQSDLRSPEEIGQTAAKRTLERMNPRRPKTGAYPVLYDERISSSLIGHLLSAVNGGAIARGSSWLLDAMGTQVLPEGFDLLEDPHAPRKMASRPFDAEGLATQKRAIVKDGVLQGWTLDLATGRKLGMESTANATRGTSSAPSPSPWNIEMTQGDKTRKDLIRDMGTGLLVTSMIGATINPNTGDYSRGAAGYWVENGELAYPVSGVTIAGSLPAMLKTLIPANDARPWLSRVVPSLLVEGMTLAGE